MSTSYATKQAPGLFLLATALVAGSVAALAPPDLVDRSATGRVAAASLTATPSSAIAGEEVELEGKVSANGRRKVVLQRRKGGSWVKEAARNTTRTGRFDFSIDARATTTIYRVQAPAAAGLPVTTTPARTVKTLDQKASLVLASSATVGSSVSATATFTPARPGRPVLLQRQSGTAWVTEATGTQSAGGSASLAVGTASAGTRTYRVVTSAADGAAAATSGTRSITINGVVPPPAPDTTAPGPVSGLSVTGTSTTSITLTWANPGDSDLAGVMIRRVAGTTPPSSPTSGTLVVQKAGTSHTDLGLTPGTQYAYAVFAYDEVPNYSSGASTTGSTQAPDTTPPGAVTGLSVTGTTTTSITLSWTNPGDGDLGGVMIRRAAGSTPPASPTAGTLVVSKSGTSHTDTGLSAATQYSYAVFAYDEVPNYSGGTTTSGTTQAEAPDTTPPGAVTGLSVTGTTTGSITLAWTNPGDGDLAGVMIRRATGSTPPATPTSGTLVVSKTGTSHTDTGLSAATQYAYAVFAYDEVPNYATGATTTGTTAQAPDTTPPGPVTGAGATKTSSTVTLTWTNPGAADFEGVVIRRAQGATPPSTPTSGTAVSDVAAPGATHTDTGLSASTQYSYALFAHDEVPNHAAAATVTVTTDAATASEWTQPGHDAGHTGWSPDETTITPANGASVAEEFTIPGDGAPAIAGGLLYTTGTTPLGPTTLAAYDLATAQQSWQITTSGQCKGPLAVTSTLVIASCGGVPRAYDRGGSHAVAWDVAETDPGQSVQYHLVVGTTLVAWTNTKVAAYRLSDGQRLWQQLLPSGATSVWDVAASGSTVVVAYDDRLRALGLANGSQTWVRTDVDASSLVIAGSWVYVNDEVAARQLALATGADGWTATTPDVYRIVAADGDTVYVWEAVFNFSSPYPSVLHALRTSDGTQRWEQTVPSRIGSVAVTGDLVWLTSTGIYNQEHASDLIALKRSDGAEVKSLDWDDNMYDWTDVAFGAGKVVFDQGGSAGGPNRYLRVFGLAGPVPVITDRVVPLAYLGTAYSRQLTAQGSGPMSWSIVSGTLPTGMSLSGAGLLSGTPTVAGTTRVRVQVTGGNGRSARRFISVQAVQTGTPAWGSFARNATRNPFEPSVPSIDVDTAPSLAFRWKTAAPGTSQTSYNNPVTVGNRLYEVGVDGVLRAWDTTGSATNRAALWSVLPATGSDPASLFTSTPVVDGTRLILLDQHGYLNARSTVDGAPLWRVATDLSTYPFKGVLVTGTTILGVTHAGGVKAYSVTDGSPLWGGAEAAAPTDFYSNTLSTDGTLVFTVTACELYAIRVSNGTIAWNTPVSADPGAYCGFIDYAPAPIVVEGVVYASTPLAMLSANAATGAPITRMTSGARGSHAVVGGVWMFTNDNGLYGVDAASGDVLWRAGVGGGGGLAVSRDLVVVQEFYGTVYGFDRLTGEMVWDGSSGVGSTGASPAIGSTRIFASQPDGVHAFGPL